MSSETNLVKTFGRSLLGNSVDPSLDISKLSVDVLLEDSTLVEGTPVIKSIRSAGKIVMPVSDKLLCKRLAAFFQAFNSAGLSQVKKDKHVDNLSQDKNLDSEYEQVLIFIEQSSQLLQAQFLGRTYAAYWNGDFNWDRFQELAEANSRMFIGDYSVLQSAASGKTAALANGDHEAAIIRLASLGLIFDLREKNSGISLTEFGIDFSTYLGLAKTVAAPAPAEVKEKKETSEEEDPFEGLILDKPIFEKLKTDDEPAKVEKTAPAVVEKKEEKEPAKPASAGVFAAAPSKPAEETPKAAPDTSAFKPIESKKPAAEAPKAVPVSSAFKPIETKKPEPKAAPKAASEPSPFKAADKKPEAGLPKSEPGASPFKPIEKAKPKTEAPKAAAPKAMPDSSPFKPIETKKPEPKAPTAAAPKAVPDSSPFKPIETKKPEPKAPTAAAPKAVPDSSPFKPIETKKPEPKAAPKTAEPSPFKAIDKKPETAPAKVPSESSPFKPLESSKPAEAPKAATGASPFKPAADAEAPKAADSSPFKNALAKLEADQPKPQRAADPSLFHLTASTKQEVEESESKSGSSQFKHMGLGNPDGESLQGSPKLGSYMSMDSDGDSYQEQTKLGSYSSLGSDDSDEKLPQRTESPSHFFPMSQANSNAASHNGSDSSPSPFKKPASAKPESEAPKTQSAPSPFKPLDSGDSNGASQGTRSPFKPLGS